MIPPNRRGALISIIPLTDKLTKHIFLLSATFVRDTSEPCSHSHLPPLVLWYAWDELAHLPFLLLRPGWLGTSAVDVLLYRKPPE